MTFLYALVLYVFYWRTGKKDPLSKLFKAKGGGGGDAGLGSKGGVAGKGGGGGGGGKSRGQLVVKLFHDFRIVVLFAVVVLVLASPFTFFGWESIGAFLGEPTLWALGGLAKIVNVTGAAVATALLLIALGVFAIDTLADLEINAAAKNCLIVMPLLALISIGPVATWMQGVNANVRETATSSVSWAWGA